jgi:hypothetical protein
MLLLLTPAVRWASSRTFVLKICLREQVCTRQLSNQHFLSIIAPPSLMNSPVLTMEDHGLHVMQLFHRHKLLDRCMLTALPGNETCFHRQRLWQESHSFSAAVLRKSRHLLFNCIVVKSAYRNRACNMVDADGCTITTMLHINDPSTSFASKTRRRQGESFSQCRSTPLMTMKDIRSSTMSLTALLFW